VTERVLATTAALQAARTIQTVIRGGLQQNVQEVLVHLQTLSNPAVWDGPQADQFRRAQAPRHQASMRNALVSMRQLSSHADSAVVDITTAGSRGPLGGSPAGTAPVTPMAGATQPSGGIDPASIPAGDDPGANAAWWRANADWWHSLSRDQQLAYFRDHPDLAARVGSLDGIPSDVRDAANRAVLAQQMNSYVPNLRQKQTALDQQQSDLQQELDGLELQRSMGYDVSQQEAQVRAQMADVRNQQLAVQQALDGAPSMLKGMRQIQDRLDRPPQPPDPNAAYLLGLDTNGSGHYILAVGNPDTADNVVTYVPGVNNTMATSNWSVDITNNLKRATDSAVSQSANPNRRTSVIAWMNYDSPQGVQAFNNRWTIG